MAGDRSVSWVNDYGAMGPFSIVGCWVCSVGGAWMRGLGAQCRSQSREVGWDVLGASLVIKATAVNEMGWEGW